MGFAKGRVWKLDERALVDCFPYGGGTAGLFEQLNLEIRELRWWKEPWL